MIIEVKIGEFRNRLSAYLKKIRQGAEIVISDRDNPIGRVLPFAPKKAEENWVLLEPTHGYSGLARLKYPPSSFHATAELLKERRSR